MSTTTATPNVSSDANQTSILDRCICISVTISGIGNRRKVSNTLIKERTITPESAPNSSGEDVVEPAASEEQAPQVASEQQVPLLTEVAESQAEQEYRDSIEGDKTAAVLVSADKDWIAASKKLLDSAELKAITQLDGEVRQYLAKLCLPSTFRSGIYLIPIELIEKVEDKLKEFQKERQDRVDAFTAVYDEKVREARGRLRELFNDGDYKSIGEVIGSFGFEWQYINMGTPTRLQGVRRELYEQERQKMAAKWQEATNEVTLLLRQTMKGFVDNLVDRLTPAEDGKKKRFKASSIEGFMEFLGNFDLRNVTDDAQLQKLVNDARALMGGVEDIESLRSDDGLRNTLRQGFQQIATAIDPLVESAGSRAISFADEV